MKTRLIIIIGIIGMIIFPLIVPEGFSQCIYNEDWPDAPCFDMGPVNHLEYYKGWAPYYDHKGAEWMETKKIEMNQQLENNIIEKWVDEKLENYNVYRYYLSTNEIQSQLPYDTLFVILDLNFLTFRDLIKDLQETGNPNECWVQGDNGTMVRCVVDDGMASCVTDDTINLDCELH